ncbi:MULTISPECIES: hypothetical protein [Pseudobutyrivibrio]|jgi:hypothetical protein|uniref:Uncharacterized protein n=1 Tax=Pseudobutyrivibrio xylanivorans DSM 14809 TaxID=1123012 RepID=A0A1M6KB91_PSEXY|nr:MULTISPECIES: hypothetical protein [Pseudobutyrivibrio]MDC7279451.1 hypothetical protein [Butyrivibrio fibrisolvens]SHJ56231.1 hypothetical protein SAMN02745725_02815 [Pseudobutyrivibrio xylanivorans DSM 14809]
MDKEYLKQSLSDAGCCNEATDTILERFESGSIDEMVRLLKKERCRAMDEYHECGRKVDCMDFMLRKIENEMKQR